MIALFKQDPAAALDKTRRKLSNVEDNIASLRAKRAEVLLSSEDAGAVVTRPSPMCLEAIGNRMSMCMAIRLNGKLEAQHRFSMSRGGLPNATSPPSAALSAQQPRRPNVSGLVGLRLPSDAATKPARFVHEFQGFLNDLAKVEPWCSATEADEAGAWVVSSFDHLERVLLSIAQAGP
jgi:hypothetical protein